MSFANSSGPTPLLCMCALLNRLAIAFSRDWRLSDRITLASLVYWEAWKKKLHVEQFGVIQIRVLTVTESATRVEYMLSAVEEITAGKGFFLFASSRDAGAPLERLWRTGKGRTVRISD